jgi:hypothetical protein
MATRWKELSDTAKDVAGTWTAYTAMGSFSLYFLGYLSLRFHLTALGIATDLAVFDEHYLFAGARFLVYLLASLPNVLLLLLVLSLFTILPYWVFSRQLNTMTSGRMKDWEEWLWAWWSVPNRLCLAGIILSLIMIQTIMRQCFLLSNVLLKSSLPKPQWLQSVFLSQDTGPWSLYFPSLVAGTIATAGLCFLARRTMEPTPLSRLLYGLFMLLVAVQCLLLPINHSILIADKTMPKVVNLGNLQDLEQGQEAWLVWDGKEWMTYLVRSKDTRKLITIPRNDVKKLTILAYDPIGRLLFAEPEKQALPRQDSPKEGSDR